MTAGEALRYGFSAVKQNMLTLMYILLIIYFPINILSGYISTAELNLQAGIDIASVLSSQEAIENFALTPEYIQLAKYSLLSTVTEAALSPFGAMAVIYTVKNCFEGRETDFKEALSVSFSNGGRFIMSMVIYSICVSLLSIFGIVPGIFLGVVWHFYLQAIVLDDCAGISSLGFSRLLVKGRWWRTFWYVITFFCMNYVLSYLIGIVFSLGAASYMSTVVMGLILSFMDMVFTAAETAVYINYQGNRAIQEK